MANNCYIDILIETYNKEDADKIDAVLSKRYFEARKENKGMFIGSLHRYLFDASIERQDNNEIRVMGWVKWSINYDEAIEIIDWLTVINVSYISIRYEEMGCCLYGEYVYNDENKLLTDTFVSENDFPDYKDGDNDLFYEELEEAFQKKGIEELVHDYYPYEKVQNNPTKESKSYEKSTHY